MLQSTQLETGSLSQFFNVSIKRFGPHDLVCVKLGWKSSFYPNHPFIQGIGELSITLTNQQNSRFLANVAHHAYSSELTLCPRLILLSCIQLSKKQDRRSMTY